MASVLVVDDANFMRRKIKEILEKAGHKVIAEANDGSKAINSYKAYKPDIVTMDISMPNDDGLYALEEIIKYDSKAKIVMISSMQHKITVVNAIKRGARSYILKPFSEEKIIRTINDVLSLE